MLAVGLILALAVPRQVVGIDLEQIGWILTGVGGLSLGITVIVAALASRRHKEVVDVRTDVPLDDRELF